MLHPRRQLDGGVAAGVGVNPVEGALLCTFGGGWILLGGRVRVYLLLRVRFCAPSRRIVVAELGAWGANRG